LDTLSEVDVPEVVAFYRGIADYEDNELDQIVKDATAIHEANENKANLVNRFQAKYGVAARRSFVIDEYYGTDLGIVMSTTPVRAFFQMLSTDELQRRP